MTFARIIILCTLGTWVACGLRFLCEWIGIPFLPIVFGWVLAVIVALIAGALIGLETGRYEVTQKKRTLVLALFAVGARIGPTALAFVAARVYPGRGLGNHDGGIGAVLPLELLWVAIGFLVAWVGAALAQRTVKEVSERPTGQM